LQNLIANIQKTKSLDNLILNITKKTNIHWMRDLTKAIRLNQETTTMQFISIILNIVKYNKIKLNIKRE